MIETNNQFIHYRVTGMGRHDWLFTSVYGSPRESEHVEQWEAMSGLAEDNNIPWLLAGDFNDIKEAE